MTINNSPSEQPDTPATKQPYEKPSFRYEQVFVTTALSCGKVGTGTGSCLQHPSAS
jgi:hypothetical protein